MDQQGKKTVFEMTRNQFEDIEYGVQTSLEILQSLTSFLQDYENLNNSSRIFKTLDRQMTSLLKVYGDIFEAQHLGQGKELKLEKLVDLMPSAWKKLLGLTVPGKNFQQSWLVLWRQQDIQESLTQMAQVQAEKVIIESRKKLKPITKNIQVEATDLGYLGLDAPLLPKGLVGIHMQENPRLTIKFIVESCFRNPDRLKNFNPNASMMKYEEGKPEMFLDSIVHKNIYHMFNNLEAPKAISGSLVNQDKHKGYKEAIKQNQWVGPYFHPYHKTYEFLQVNKKNQVEGWVLRISQGNQEIKLGEMNAYAFIGFCRTVSLRGCQDKNYHDGGTGYVLMELKGNKVE